MYLCSITVTQSAATPSVYSINLINGFTFNLWVRLNVGGSTGETNYIAPNSSFEGTFSKNASATVQIMAPNDAGLWKIIDNTGSLVNDGSFRQGLWASVLQDSDIVERQGLLPFTIYKDDK